MHIKLPGRQWGRRTALKDKLEVIKSISLVGGGEFGQIRFYFQLCFSSELSLDSEFNFEPIVANNPNLLLNDESKTRLSCFKC